MTTNTERVWFTSDIHFGHQSMITYCNRPWKTADEMDDGIIRIWNNTVDNADRVYILGDLSMHNWNRSVEILDQLNGQKYLIAGNHDSKLIKNSTFKSNFHWIKDLFTLKVKDPDAHNGRQLIVLCHYAMKIWNQSHHGAWHLHGHSHGSLNENPNKKRIDVGFDVHYRPVEYQEIKSMMVNRPEWKPVDHHGTH